MKLADEKKLLPKNIIRFSKKMVALSVVLLLAGYGLIVSPWAYGRTTSWTR